MKKVYESPELEIQVFMPTECIMASWEGGMQEQVTEFVDPTGTIDEL